MKQGDKIKLATALAVLLLAGVLIVWQSGLLAGGEDPALLAVPQEPVQQRGGGLMMPPPG
jgi:hypothetical protein